MYLAFNDHVRETVPLLVDRPRRVGFDLEPKAIVNDRPKPQFSEPSS
jgi:hypothetical protein